MGTLELHLNMPRHGNNTHTKHRLNHKGPFPWDTVIPSELAYYRSKANKFGIPMDPRHTYVKSDWLSWIAAMAPSDSEFQEIFNQSLTSSILRKTEILSLISMTQRMLTSPWAVSLPGQ